MLYFFDKKILNDKILYKQLYTILGINIKTACLISAKFGLGIKCKVNYLPFDITKRLLRRIQKKFLTGNNLLNEVNTNYALLIVIKSYRGFRHRNLLPSRGQRTHTNAKTRQKR